MTERHVAKELRSVAEEAARIVGHGLPDGNWIVVISGTIKNGETVPSWQWFFSNATERVCTDIAPVKLKETT
jgi:hypothetical protein